jgi:arylsulfatase A-like enzyme
MGMRAKRVDALRGLGRITCIVACALSLSGFGRGAVSPGPNVVLIMADDLGWGDVGYNGNLRIRTPVLDAWAKEGVRLDRFYSGAPVCTPTRASCLTGRNAARTGVLTPSQYPFPRGEITIASYLQNAGYATGFFGKWHLGKLTPGGDERFANQAPVEGKYGAPWHFGFETVVAAEITVPTYNPEVWEIDWGWNVPENQRKMVMDRPLRLGEGTLVGESMPRWGYGFWRGEGMRYEKSVAGDTSALLVREANTFIERAVSEHKPFLAVVWFFTAHAPLAAGDEDRAQYSHLSLREQHAFGAISAMDRAIGSIRETLKAKGVAENTLIWFCSDNGPSWVHELYSAGPYRGRKSDLYEGGIRVPALVEWPARIKGRRVVMEAISTDDFLPTILAATGLTPRDERPIDGINVLPLLEGKAGARDAPLFFESVVRNEQATTVASMFTDVRQNAMMDGPWKIISRDGGATYQLYQLEDDPAESRDLARGQRERLSAMRRVLDAWRKSCAESRRGKDYE